MAEAMMRANRLFAQQAWLRAALDTPFWWMAFIALATRSLYQTVAGWQEVLVYVLGHAIFYRALYWLIVERFSPWKIALLWLGSPLLLFSATWLRPLWALVFTALWGAALWWSIQQHTSPEKNASEKNTSGGVAGYLIVLAWVSVCGAGGYGYQSSDYVMHNGRLLDLIHYAWPVSYARPDGSQQLLVQYAGYYLWPALAGKMAGISTAVFVQHLWLLMGCWLALRMMALLTQVRAWMAALGLVLFGGWDFWGLLLFTALRNFSALQQVDAQWFFALLNIQGIPEWLDFWPALLLQKNIWFGNFIALAPSLLWAPHQVVAGWLVVGFLCRACYQQKMAPVLFSCALLLYWSPMIALGLLPTVLILCLWQLTNRKECWREGFSLLAGIAVVVVLSFYYASVPFVAIPHGVLSFSNVDLLVFVLFILQSWGIYAVVIGLCWSRLDTALRMFAVALFASAGFMSCMYYGDFNDLTVRFSSAFFFGILLVMVKLLRVLWQTKAYWRAVLLMSMLVPGFFSGALNVWQAASHASEQVQGISVVDYEWSWNFLGQPDSWFVRYLSADLHPQKNE